MLSCEHIKGMVADFIEQTLEPDQIRAVKAHLEDCPVCQGLAHSLERTRQLCRQALGTACPAELGQRLMAALRKSLS